MIKCILNLIKRAVKNGQPSDEERPIKFIEDRKNVWRIVYADEQYPVKE